MMIFIDLIIFSSQTDLLVQAQIEISSCTLNTFHMQCRHWIPRP